MQPALLAAIALFALAGPALGAVIIGPQADALPPGPGLGLPLDETGAVRMRLTEAPPLSMDVSSMPALDVASIPPLNISGMPALQVASMPALEVASFPALTIASMPPQTFQAEFPGSMNVTLVNPVLNVQGTLQLVEPAAPQESVVFEGRALRNYSAGVNQVFLNETLFLAHLGITVPAASFERCVIRAIVQIASPAPAELGLNKTLIFNNGLPVPFLTSTVLPVSLAKLNATSKAVSDWVLTSDGARVVPAERADVVRWELYHTMAGFNNQVDWRPTCYGFV